MRPQDDAFPTDAIELRRFRAITGLSDKHLEELRDDVVVWALGRTEFISESAGLRAIGRRARIRRSGQAERTTAA